MQDTSGTMLASDTRRLNPSRVIVRRMPDQRLSAGRQALRHKLMQFNWLQHRRFAQELAELDLTVPQFYTLNALIEMGGTSTMGALSKHVLQVSATMTGIIDRLVRDGLVQRSRSEEDRRAVHVEITPAGRELVARAWERAFDGMDDALGEMTQAELNRLHSVLDALVAMMEGHEASAPATIS